MAVKLRVKSQKSPRKTSARTRSYRKRRNRPCQAEELRDVALHNEGGSESRIQRVRKRFLKSHLKIWIQTTAT